MKSLKLLVIAALVATTMVSTVNADGFKEKPNKKVIHVNLIQAMGVPGLTAAIYDQLDDDFLVGNKSYYTKDVVYQNLIYRITDYYQMWVWFFALEGIIMEEIESGQNNN